MKKVLCVFLVVLVMALPCFAIKNSYDGSFSVSVYAHDRYDTLSSSFSDVLDYGYLYLVEFVSPVNYLDTPFDFTYTFSIPFTLESSSTVVLCTYNYARGSFNLNSFGTPISSTVVNMDVDRVLRMTYNYDWSYTVNYNASTSHSFQINTYQLDSGTYSLSFASSDGSASGNIIGVGIFIDDGSGQFTPLPTDNSSSISSGSISLPDALETLSGETEDLINGSSSYDEAIFYTVYASMLTEQYTLASGGSTVESIKDGGSFSTNITNIYNSYSNGSISITEALDSYSEAYSSALDDCSTPEEALIISTWYDMKKDELNLKYQKQAIDDFGGWVEDDIFPAIIDLHNIENEVVWDKFEEINAHDYIDLHSFLSALDGEDTSEFLGVITYIVESSCLRVFIMFPITFLCFAILLGTATKFDNK